LDICTFPHTVPIPLLKLTKPHIHMRTPLIYFFLQRGTNDDI